MSKLYYYSKGIRSDIIGRRRRKKRKKWQCGTETSDKRLYLVTECLGKDGEGT